MTPTSTSVRTARTPRLPAPPTEEITLQLLGTEHHGRLVRIASAKCTVGSAAGSTLRLKAPGVAPTHCLILRGTNGVVVRRLADEARLNGQAFEDATLQTGDRLQIGSLTFLVMELPGTRQAAEENVAEETEPAARNDQPSTAQLLAEHREDLRLMRRQGHRRARSLLNLLRTGKRQIEQAARTAESRKLELDQIARQMTSLRRELNDQRDRQRTTEEEQRAALGQVGQLTVSLERLRHDLLAAQSQRQNEADRWRLDRSRMAEDLALRDSRLHDAETNLHQKQWELEQLQLQFQRQQRQLELEHEQTLAARQRREKDVEAAQIERAALSEELLTHDRVRLQYEAELQASRRELEQLRELVSRSRQDLTDDRTALQAERIARQQATEAWSVERARLVAEVATQTQRLAALEAELTKHKTSATELQIAVDGRIAELTQLRATNDRAVREWQMERLQIIQDVGHAAAHDANLLTEHRRQLEEAAAALQARESELTEARAQIAKGDAALFALRGELEQTQQDLARGELAREAQLQKLKVAEDTIVQLQHALTESQADLASQQTSLERFQEEARQQTEQYESERVRLLDAGEQSAEQARLAAERQQHLDAAVLRQLELEQQVQDAEARTAALVVEHEQALVARAAEFEQTLAAERIAKTHAETEASRLHASLAEYQQREMQTIVFTPPAKSEAEQQELAAREALLAEQAAAVAERERLLAEQMQTCEARLAEAETRQLQLIEEERLLTERQQSLAEQQQTLANQEDSLAQRHAAAVQQQAEWEAREEQLRVKQEELARQEVQLTNEGLRLVAEAERLAAGIGQVQQCEERQLAHQVDLDRKSEVFTQPQAEEVVEQPIPSALPAALVDEVALDSAPLFDVARDEDGFLMPVAPMQDNGMRRRVEDFVPELPPDAEDSLVEPVPVKSPTELRLERMLGSRSADRDQPAEEARPAAFSMTESYHGNNDAEPDYSAFAKHEPSEEEPAPTTTAFERRLAALAAQAAEARGEVIPREPQPEATPVTAVEEAVPPVPLSYPKITPDILPSWNFEHEAPERMDTITGLRMRNLLDEVSRFPTDMSQSQSQLIPARPSQQQLAPPVSDAPLETPPLSNDDDIFNRLREAGILKDDAHPPIVMPPRELPKQEPSPEDEQTSGLSSSRFMKNYADEPAAAEVPSALNRFGLPDEVDQTISLPASEMPQGFAPAKHAPEAKSEDEDSIEAYMQQLLQRVRGDGPPAKTGTNPVYRAAAAPQSGPSHEAPKPAPVKPPAPVRDSSPVKSEDYVPRSAAPELTANLAAMRELANTQARAAIQTHQKKVGKKLSGGKVLTAIVAIATSGFLAVLAFQTHSQIAYIGAGLGLSIGVFWLMQALMLSQGWFKQVQRSLVLGRPSPMSPRDEKREGK